MSPLKAKTPNIEGLTVERFLECVIPEPNSGCWLCDGALCGDYAHFTWNGRSYGAHRVSWALFRGPIPDGYEIDHWCYVPCCVNPDHLRAVTLAENRKRTRRSDPYSKKEESMRKLHLRGKLPRRKSGFAAGNSWRFGAEYEKVP